MKIVIHNIEKAKNIETKGIDIRTLIARYIDPYACSKILAELSLDGDSFDIPSFLLIPGNTYILEEYNTYVSTDTTILVSNKDAKAMFNESLVIVYADVNNLLI